MPNCPARNGQQCKVENQVDDTSGQHAPFVINTSTLDGWMPDFLAGNALKKKCEETRDVVPDGGDNDSLKSPPDRAR